MIPISVWVVEDDMVYRQMLSRVFKGAEQVSDCSVFPSCIEMFEALEAEEHPDIVLMDLGLPEMSGVQGIKKLASLAPDITAVVLTVFKEKEKVMEALEAGAAGYLLKSAAGTEIIKGLQDVFFGGSALSPSIAKLVLKEIQKPAASGSFGLTGRELEVLEQLALGLSVKEVAASLNISRSTAANHLNNIYVKLQVQSQSGAVAKALRSGIIK